MNTQEAQRKAAEGVTWDLSELYSGPEDARIHQDLEEVNQTAQDFADRYRGKIGNDLTSEQLAAAMQELEGFLDKAYRPACYAQLLFSADTADDRAGALMQSVQEKMTEVSTHLIFFDLEWIQVDDQIAEQLVSDPRLERYRHYLRTIRKYKDHRLSEPEERIMAELENTGASAFQRLFDQLMGDMRFQVALRSGATEMGEEEVLTLLHNPDRPTRKAGADALTAGLKDNRRLLTFIYNNLVQDHAVSDRLLKFEDPMDSRNLSNEIDRATVDALLTSCEANTDLVQRYYRLKAKLVGIDDFTEYDRYAPIDSGEEKVIPFQEAREIVLGAYNAFSPDMAGIAEEFFEQNWIDAEVRDGKRGGAFSHGMVPSTHPYVFLNYAGGRRDVQTLAHELGHGVHQYLGREQGLFHADTPLTTAETASVFGEMLVFQRLLRDTTDKQAKLALLCGKLEDSFATVFRQAIMTRFEQSVHHARRAEGELTTDRINALWMEANRKMFGDSIELREEYGYWWMYIPHFIHTPFYTYAYSFGELLVLALYKRYEEEGEDFVPRYVALLSAGGSDKPEVLLRKAGVDITHPDFWNGGLAVLRRMVEEVEALV